MSGTLKHRVNRGWDSTTQAGVAAARFFWDWLHFINIHTGLAVVEVGTGTTSHGTTIPTEWLGWNGVDNPTTLSPIPLDSNSWIVFRAIYADPLLNGGGTMQWEAKLQMTMGTAYDDPSGIDYGLDGQTHNVVLRACPAGGWTGSGTWDFIPAMSQPSQDFRLFGYTSSQADKDYVLDIVGDDDTIWWRGAAADFTGDSKEDRVRGGYLGMINRRNADITWPFFVMAGPLCDLSSSRTTDGMIFSRHSEFTEYGLFNYEFGNLRWRTYSLGFDNIKVGTHRVDVWHLNTLSYMTPYHFTDEGIYPRMLLLQYEQPNHFAIIGEFRGYVVTPTSIGFSVVFGDTLEYIQIGAYPATYGGFAMPWPTGISPIW